MGEGGGGRLGGCQLLPSRCEMMSLGKGGENGGKIILDAK